MPPQNVTRIRRHTFLRQSTDAHHTDAPLAELALLIAPPESSKSPVPRYLDIRRVTATVLPSARQSVSVSAICLSVPTLLTCHFRA